MNLNRIGLLDDEENPLVDPQSALAQYQPQQVATAPQKPQGISLLQRLGMAFIPETMAAISNAKAQQAAPVDGGYEALAEYWAKQGNFEKAKQYMALSGIGVDERFNAMFEAEDGNTYQLRKGADPVLIGRTAKEKSDAGYTEEGIPPTETKPGKLPVGWFWNPITNSAERIPGLPIKPERQPAAPKPKAGGSAPPKPPKPPKPATISELTGLSKSFSQETKDDSAVAGSWRNLYSNAALGTPAGDIAVIYAYMKLQDPTSVVREGEFATAQNAGGIHETIRARLNQAIGAGRLTPRLRSEILGSAKATLNSRRSQFSAKQDRFTKLAKSKGIDPELVIGNPYADLPGFDKPATSVETIDDRRKRLGLPPSRAKGAGK